MSEDKRMQARYDSQNLSYICEDENGAIRHEGMGRTLNVSEGGILLETNFQMSPNNTLILELALADRLLNLHGQVVYSYESMANRFRTGVEFLELNDVSRKTLTNFMRSIN